MIKIKVGVLVEKDDSLLLIRELNDSDGKYYWNIIKGTFEPKRNEDLFTAVIRECREEAGITVEIKNLLNIQYIQKKSGWVFQFNFIATIKEGIPQVSSQDLQKQLNENITDVKFFSKVKLKKIGKNEFMNSRAFAAVNDWLIGKRYNTEAINIIDK
ncbi:MAG: NUDIX hydrolase [Patescibacteria group bacterium]